MTALTKHWPLFRLRLRTGSLELRYPSDDDLAVLADLAAGGVHPPEQMPFLSAWTDLPRGELERGVLQWHWRGRAEWSSEGWAADFVVLRNGEVVGSQGIGSQEFAVRRTVVTGSWLGLRHQNQGTGTGMRHAILALAFEGLRALEAHSGAFEDNPQSAAVSRKLGYREAGHAVHVRRGQRAVETRFVLGRESWERSERPVVEIDGLDACREMFGA
jgi:RimJ/RimL family protein N-acetyltransferase